MMILLSYSSVFPAINLPRNCLGKVPDYLTKERQITSPKHNHLSSNYKYKELCCDHLYFNGFILLKKNVFRGMNVRPALKILAGALKLRLGNIPPAAAPQHANERSTKDH